MIPASALCSGLGLISLGSGGIKPCVSANVGDQFGESNKHLLSKVFGWFYFSINAGSFISTIFCPFLLNDPRLGPTLGLRFTGCRDGDRDDFFLAGRKKFVHIPPAGIGFFKQTFSKEGLEPLAGWRSFTFSSLFSGRSGIRAAAARGRCRRRKWTCIALDSTCSLAGADGEPDLHSDVHSARELRPLSADRPIFHSHTAAQNRDRSFSHRVQLCCHLVYPENDRCRRQPGVSGNFSPTSS